MYKKLVYVGFMIINLLVPLCSAKQSLSLNQLEKAIGRIDKQVKHLTELHTTHPEHFLLLVAHLEAFFIRCNYKKKFKHPLTRQCITQLCHTKSIEPLERTWNLFKRATAKITNAQLFLEEFAIIMVIVYRDLMLQSAVHLDTE